MYYWLTYLILLFLIFLCFWVPYKSGNKKTGIVTAIIFMSILLWTIISDLEFISILFHLLIIAFSLIFLTYWTFKFFKLRRIAIISSTILFIIFAYIGLDPWIQDWTFSENNAINILNRHGFTFDHEIKIISNESGGLTDYYHVFVLSLSEIDYNKIKHQIVSSPEYIGFLNRDWYIKRPELLRKDSLSYEDEFNYIRDYRTQTKMKDGTFHFIFELSKTEYKLKYVGSNE